MSRRASTVLFRLTLVCAVAAGLTACGRKGPLDLPPTASAAPAAEPSAIGPLAPPIGSAAAPAPGSPANPPPPNRAFVLDPLLN